MPRYQLVFAGPRLFARALRGAAIGDVRRVDLPAGEREYEVMAIAYP